MEDDKTHETPLGLAANAGTGFESADELETALEGAEAQASGDYTPDHTDDDEIAEDVCGVCGVTVGYGVRIFHLGRCDEHAHNICECTDMGCPAHRGFAFCGELQSLVVYRIDMIDETGTAMCDGCSTDALNSGVFTTEAPKS